jgi:uncharacterized OB-fold protein
MEKYTITSINRKPFTSKAGKDFVRVYVKTEETGPDTLITGLENAGNKNWNVGEVVAMEIEKVEKDGRDFWNFTNPRPHEQSNLEGRVVRLETLFKDHLARHEKDDAQ